MLGWGFGQLNNGVMLAAPGSSFLSRWREAFRAYEPTRWDYGACNVSTALAAAMGTGHVHAAPELGPLPRYASRAAYERHLAAAPIAHLSGFRHPWRLEKIMQDRLLETVWRVVARAINRSDAAGERADPELRACMHQVENACWANPGKKCGIYGG